VVQQYTVYTVHGAAVDCLTIYPAFYVFSVCDKTFLNSLLKIFKIMNKLNYELDQTLQKCMRSIPAINI